MCGVCVPENSLQVLLPYSLRVFREPLSNFDLMQQSKQEEKVIKY